MDEFTKGYMKCALWVETDESTPSGGNPLDDNYTVLDFAQETIDKMTEDCRKFQERAKSELETVYQKSYDASSAGYDFYLSRNGHGAGFFDNGDDPVWDTIQEMAKGFGECDLYVGDDGKIYLE